MIGALPYLTANGLWLASGLRSTLAFQRALRNPRRAQEALLRRLLHRNAACDYGRTHHFDRLRSPREYQDAVPSVTYEELTPQIEAICRGRQGVLTSEPVLMLEKTSGSTSASKYIPYTASLRREFGAAVAPWMADLYFRRPRMLRGGAYWSVSPLSAERERTEGGLAVGFAEDTEYFGGLERLLLERLILTPRELPRVPDMETSRYVTLRFLLQSDRLAFISVWNASFLTLLLEAAQEHPHRLVRDIHDGTLSPPAALPPGLHAAFSRRLRPLPRRAARLEALLCRGGPVPFCEVWPLLAVVSCWADASAHQAVPELRRLLPGVEVQPKGLLATEGVVSIPLTGHPGAAVAVTSHFLEFVDEEAPAERPRLADELEEGRSYQVLLTTGGGLYRYAPGDRVQMAGYVEATPLIRFLGRVSAVSDLCGEKLHEERVAAALAAAFRRCGVSPRFAMVAPEWGQPPTYTLYLECEELSEEGLQRLVREVGAGLMEGYHYAYCRRLGQLGALRGCRVRDGSRTYLERCITLGQRAGSVKPVALHREPGWAEWFESAADAAVSRA